MAPNAPLIVAAVQAAPAFLDRAATVAKACRLIAEAADHGAGLILFPEAFVPAYPDWAWLVPAGQAEMLDGLYAQLVANAVSVPDEATRQLGRAARQARAMVAIGINERNSEASGGSLYNTLLYIDAGGEIMGRHRKLMPTGGERTVWAQGDGRTLAAYRTPLGTVSGLICWENYMPLARSALYAWGTQIYLAPTWDRGPVWQATLRHIAREGGVFVIGCCMPLHLDHIPDGLLFKALYPPETGWINSGGSLILNPYGQILAGPVDNAEEILYATVDLSQVAGARRMLDVAGHYGRPDVFSLTVHQAGRPRGDEEGAGED